MELRRSQASSFCAVVARARSALAVAALFSLGVNLLMLTAPIYMLQVFDRVLTSRSLETLALLSILAVIALATLGILDITRSLILARLGSWIDRRLGGQVIGAGILGAAGASGRDAGGLRDLATIRAFLGGPGMIPLLDFPWTPVFLAVIFLLHPKLGAVAIGGAIALAALAVAHEFLTRRRLAEATVSSARATRDVDAALQNADAITAMGMLPALVRRWQERASLPDAQQFSAARRSAIVGGGAKFLRSSLQIGILGLGATLVLQGELSPGGMIAASILMGRALAPIEMAITSWRSAVTAYGAYLRLRRQLAGGPPTLHAVQLPAPNGRLAVDKVTFAFPEHDDPQLRGVGFGLDRGDSLAVVGPTAAGKTTLARLLVGNLTPRFGSVRLDGADSGQWPQEWRHRHIGYLPQDIELFAGTVAENIARLASLGANLGAGAGSDGAADVVAAARFVGAHDMILALHQGYGTQVGVGGAALSGGQRQWIALARAVYGDPRLVVLDEPNANLDQAGEAALIQAMKGLKQRGATVVLIAHRAHLLQHVDKILLLLNGRVQLFGSRQDVLPQLIAPVTAEPERIVAHA